MAKRFDEITTSTNCSIDFDSIRGEKIKRGKDNHQYTNGCGLILIPLFIFLGILYLIFN